MGGPGSGRRDEGVSSNVSVAKNGQIKLKRPKNITEAISMLKDMGVVLENAMSDQAKNPKDVTSSLRLRHAHQQMSRAITMAKAHRRV